MQVDLPAEQQMFIENVVASGRFSSQNDAICEAVRLLVSRERLKDEIRIGVEQAERGMLIDHDTVFDHLRMMAAGQQRERGQ